MPAPAPLTSKRADPPKAAHVTPPDVAKPLEDVRVLIVDDEPNVTAGIARHVRRSHPQWQVVEAHHAEAAIGELKTNPFQVVLSDMNMPGVTGTQLLKRVAELQPDCVRLMLTGQADINTAMAAVNEGGVFRLLFKPCDARLVVAALGQAERQYRLQTAERDLLRSKLEHAQRLAVVGEFTAGIVHDVNNLLSVMTTLTGDDQLFSPEQSLKMIRDSALRASELTSELMGFSRRDANDELTLIELGPLIDGSAKLLRPMLAHRHTLLLDVPEGLPPARSHPGRLRQILSNLVINARDATPEHGVITVAVESVAAGRRSSGGLDTASLCLSVSDTGCGMNEETRRRLFEPFFTTKGEGRGTGLGMALVRQLVDRLEGRITVESEVGVGSRFAIYVPEYHADELLDMPNE
jgi:signal transduction histidine kinase